MSINAFCSKCKRTSALKSKCCSKCGYDFADGRKYRVVVRNHEGKRVTKVLNSITLAKKLESKLRTKALERNLLGINEAPLVDDIWKRYLSWAALNKKSAKDDQARWENHVAPLLKNRRMDLILPMDIHRVITSMKNKRDYAPATIRQVLVLIKRIYNWASDMGLYDGKNPAARIKHPKLNNEVTECLTKEEIKRLLVTLSSWKNKRVALLIRFALYTGLRRGELFSLKWKDVDLQNGVINLRNTKGGKDESLPISDEALNILCAARALLPSPDCSNVFPNKWGRKRRTFGNTWTYIKTAAGIPLTFRFHGLRHTYASYLASSGKVSQFTLQKLLTHKSPQMTQRYAHLFDQTLRDGANVLATMIE